MTRTRLLQGLLLAILLGTAPAVHSGVTIGIDVATLNKLLPVLTPTQVSVPVSETNRLTVELRGFKVLGLDPGANGNGQILTSVTLFVRELGLEVPLEPRLVLLVIDEGKELELRFSRAQLNLPLGGGFDIARFLQPLRFPAQNVFAVAGARGDVQVTSHLREVKMGAKVIQFEIDLEPAP